MTYLERLKEVDLKMSTHRVGTAECEIEYGEIISDMADKIGEQATEIEDLKDELRNYREEKLEKSLGG